MKYERAVPDDVPSSLIPHPSSLHLIRLRGAWAATPDGALTRHARRFGWPTALDPHERVWLVCAAAPVAVALNGAPLAAAAPGAPFAADISLQLLPRNELVVTTRAGAQAGDVWLEVRRADSAGA